MLSDVFVQNTTSQRIFHLTSHNLSYCFLRDQSTVNKGENWFLGSRLRGTDRFPAC